MITFRPLRSLLTFSAALMMAIGTLSSYAQDINLPKVLANYTNPDGTLNVDRLQRDYAEQVQAARPSTSPAVSTTSPARQQTKAAQKEPFTLFLRKNFEDLYLFDQPTPVGKAHGAEISWSRDEIAHNSLWSVHGMAAVAYTIPGDYAHSSLPSVLGISLAPYVQVDRELNSNPKLKTKNVDTLTAGGTGEIGFDNLLGGLQFFRGRVGAVSDNKNRSIDVASVLEWLPLYGDYCIGFPCSLFGLPMVYNFQPELKTQLDRTTDEKHRLLFSNRDSAIRIGPQFTFLVKPFGPDIGLLSRITGSITYHFWTELYSGHTGDWFEPSLTYNLDEAGHLGLSLDYRQGRQEETGQNTKLVKISLTGKL